MNADQYAIDQAIRNLIGQAGSLQSFLDSVAVVLYNENSEQPGGGFCPCDSIAELVEAAQRRANELQHGGARNYGECCRMSAKDCETLCIRCALEQIDLQPAAAYFRPAQANGGISS